MPLPQPVPPSWKDLGKSSTDLLQKDYPFHATSLEVKTKTPSNVVFRAFGTQAHGDDKVVGDLEAKYADYKNGVVFTQAWTTSNVLRTQVELENQVAKGLKFDVLASLAPEKGTKSALVNAVYKQSGLHTRATVDLFKGPTVTADTVFGRDGFLVGVEGAYNLTEGKIARYAAALGYNAPEYAVSVHALNNFKQFSAAYYHRVSPDVEAGAKAVYDTKHTSPGVSLEVGAKTYLDAAAFVKAKINDKGVLALGYTQALRPGVKASFGLALDTKSIGSAAPTVGNSHKLGAAFTFEA